MVEQIFHLPQMKRNVLLETNWYILVALRVAERCKSRVLENKETSEKSQKLLVVWCLLLLPK